jgi:AcrR family transcriptional regulator
MSEANKKTLIVDTFIDQVESGSLKSVHIAKLIKQLDINRNTFYYHFDSKYDVALYVFRRDLAPELQAGFPESELVSKPLSNKRSSVQLPYYIHREVGARTLDLSGFYKAIVRCILNRPHFYGSLFDVSQTEFRAYIEMLYRPAVEDDIKFVLGGRYLPDCVFDYFADYHTRYIFHIAQYYSKHMSTAREMLEDKINPFWNMPYEALSHELQTHAIQRPRDSV